MIDVVANLNIDATVNELSALAVCAPSLLYASKVMKDNLRRICVKIGLDREEFERIPPEFLVPALQGAALCDEEELRELWANLLRNAANKDDTTKPRSAFVDILRGLTRDDALMLKAFAADNNYHPDYNDERQRISRDNLKRLAVIDNSGGFDGARDRLSSLGAAFLRAVS